MAEYDVCRRCEKLATPEYDVFVGFAVVGDRPIFAVMGHRVTGNGLLRVGNRRTPKESHLNIRRYCFSNDRCFLSGLRFSLFSDLFELL